MPTTTLTHLRVNVSSQDAHPYLTHCCLTHRVTLQLAVLSCVCGAITTEQPSLQVFYNVSPVESSRWFYWIVLYGPWAVRALYCTRARGGRSNSISLDFLALSWQPTNTTGALFPHIPRKIHNNERTVNSLKSNTGTAWNINLTARCALRRN